MGRDAKARTDKLANRWAKRIVGGGRLFRRSLDTMPVPFLLMPPKIGRVPIICVPIRLLCEESA
jgi:hypothetical protein